MAHQRDERPRTGPAEIDRRRHTAPTGGKLMSYRPERVAHAVRDVVSEAISLRLSDPRIHRFTSITRVEMSGDLRQADVYVSVMGTETEGRTTMKGLESARGIIQGMLAKRLDMRQCPSVRFHLDLGIKIAIETIRKIDEVMHQETPADRSRDPGASTQPDAGQDPAHGADA